MIFVFPLSVSVIN